MAEGQSRRRSDRFVIAIFALIGAVIGFLLFLILIEPSPVEPVMMSVSTPLAPNSSATLTVTLFEHFTYTRTAASAAAFDAEIMFWQFAPVVFWELMSAMAGGLVGYFASRWFPRAQF